jgi:hypothetical protein
MTIQSVHELLEALSPLGPFRTFEDIPLSLALYPVLRFDGSFLRIREDGSNRAGKRWGMSSTWDGREEHYMVPQECLLVKRPREDHYLTAAQVFDFVYEIPRMIEAAARNAHFKKAAKLPVRVIQAPPDPRAMFAIFKRFSRILDPPFEGYGDRMRDLLKGLSMACVRKHLACFYLYREAGLVGFALMWIDGVTCFHTHRFIVSEERNLTRYFDVEIARSVASEFGCSKINIGDAHGLPGLGAYKLSLRPAQLVSYFNVLGRKEMIDHVQPRDIQREDDRGCGEAAEG